MVASVQGAPGTCLKRQMILSVSLDDELTSNSASQWVAVNWNGQNKYGRECIPTKIQQSSSYLIMLVSLRLPSAKQTVRSSRKHDLNFEIFLVESFCNSFVVRSLHMANGLNSLWLFKKKARKSNRSNCGILSSNLTGSESGFTRRFSERVHPAIINRGICFLEVWGI